MDKKQVGTSSEVYTSMQETRQTDCGVVSYLLYGACMWAVVMMGWGWIYVYA